MGICYWSSGVCFCDLVVDDGAGALGALDAVMLNHGDLFDRVGRREQYRCASGPAVLVAQRVARIDVRDITIAARDIPRKANTQLARNQRQVDRSEEHTSELQSLMRISYAVFCLKTKKKHTYDTNVIIST